MLKISIFLTELTRVNENTSKFSKTTRGKYIPVSFKLNKRYQSKRIFNLITLKQTEHAISKQNENLTKRQIT